MDKLARHESSKAMITRPITVFMFHRVLERGSYSNAKSYVRAGTVLSFNNFMRQIKRVTREYNVINLRDLVSGLSGNKQLPQNSCVLTFDDGYAEHYRLVFPVLQELGISATFFIIGGCLSGTGKIRWLDSFYYLVDRYSSRFPIRQQRRLAEFYHHYTDTKQKYDLSALKALIRKAVNKEQILQDLSQFLELEVPEKTINQRLFMSAKNISEMSRAGMEIGAHTMSHPDLGLVSFQEAEKEIIESGKEIRKMTGQDNLPFAFPFGGITTFTLKIVSCLKSNGFYCACTSVPGYNTINSDPFELRRIDINLLDKFIAT